jgi:hypothetical protein
LGILTAGYHRSEIDQIVGKAVGMESVKAADARQENVEAVKGRLPVLGERLRPARGGGIDFAW